MVNCHSLSQSIRGGVLQNEMIGASIGLDGLIMAPTDQDIFILAPELAVTGLDLLWTVCCEMSPAPSSPEPISRFRC
jgi:hypothetical protein